MRNSLGIASSSQLTRDEAKCWLGSMGIDWGLRSVEDGQGGNCSMREGLRLREGSRRRGDVPTKGPDGNAEPTCVLQLPLLLPESRAFF